MNCDEAAALLTAEADGEVDPLRAHALRRHATGCDLCGPRLQALTDLRQRLRAELIYHRAPTALRERLRAQHAPPPSRYASDRRWRWFAGGAVAGGLAVGLIAILGLVLPRSEFGADVSVRLVAQHTRATLSGQLVEVASSDRHTVKPWLSARLDYSIPVQDWASAGFPLVGARIAQLDEHPVATLVYRHREHLIDVFVRPAAAVPTALHTVRGFNIAAAEGSEMAWMAVSDLNPADLAAFVQGLARGAVAPAKAD